MDPLKELRTKPLYNLGHGVRHGNKNFLNLNYKKKILEKFSSSFIFFTIEKSHDFVYKKRFYNTLKIEIEIYEELTKKIVTNKSCGGVTSIRLFLIKKFQVRATLGIESPSLGSVLTPQCGTSQREFEFNCAPMWIPDIK